jgi:hypothetical protein
MRKSNKKLKTFEQFEEVEVVIDKKRLTGLIDMAKPVLDEIAQMVQQEDERTISVEMYSRIVAASEALEELAIMYR